MIIREHSPFFSPPEYFEDEEPHFKSDVWSLGCLLYFMVSGLNPWEDETRISTCKSVRQYLKQKQKLIDGSIDEIQEKCGFYLPLFEGCL